MESIVDKNKLGYYIKKYDLKSLFSEHLFEKYYDYMMLVKFARDEYVFRTRGKIRYIYILLSGKVKVCSLLSNGKHQLLNLVSGISVMGDLELFNIDNPFMMVQAVNEVMAIALPLDFTEEYLYQDFVFLKYVGSLLAQKVYIFTSNTALNMNYQLKNRLCSYISFASKKIVIQGIEYLYYSDNLTDTADLLSTSYRHLQRVLKELKDSDIIEKYDKGYIVKNWDELINLSSDEYFIGNPYEK